MDKWKTINADGFWEGNIAKSELWTSAAVTIHSHWLTEDEADLHWMSMSTISSKASPQWAEFKDKENAFIELFKMLNNDYGFHLWEAGNSVDNRNSSESDIIDLCRRNVREEQFNLFKSDNLQIVMMGNFDLTFPVYQPKDRKWDLFSELVHSVGLFLLFY